MDINPFHGEKIKCPTCGAPGRFDLMESGRDKNSAEYDDAIWYSKSGHWECYECWGDTLWGAEL